MKPATLGLDFNEWLDSHAFRRPEPVAEDDAPEPHWSEAWKPLAPDPPLDHASADDEPAASGEDDELPTLAEHEIEDIVDVEHEIRFGTPVNIPTTTYIDAKIDRATSIRFVKEEIDEIEEPEDDDSGSPLWTPLNASNEPALPSEITLNTTASVVGTGATTLSLSTSTCAACTLPFYAGEEIAMRAAIPTPSGSVSIEFVHRRCL